MADIKISELPSGSITRSGFVPVSLSDGSVTQKLTVEDIGSINIKRSVLLATTENIGSLYGVLIVDGVTINEGDRILVKNQTSSDQNGIYVVNSTGPWLRSNDFNANSKITRGSVVFVISGVQNKATTWILDLATQ
jgi:parallel beta-helix repeat protein